MIIKKRQKIPNGETRNKIQGDANRRKKEFQTQLKIEKRMANVQGKRKRGGETEKSKTLRKESVGNRERKK